MACAVEVWRRVTVSNRSDGVERAWTLKQEYQNASEGGLCPVFDYGIKERSRILPESAVDWSFAVAAVCHSRVRRSVSACLRSRIPLEVETP